MRTDKTDAEVAAASCSMAAAWMLPLPSIPPRTSNVPSGNAVTVPPEDTADVVEPIAGFCAACMLPAAIREMHSIPAANTIFDLMLIFLIMFFSL